MARSEFIEGPSVGFYQGGAGGIRGRGGGGGHAGCGTGTVGSGGKSGFIPIHAATGAPFRHEGQNAIRFIVPQFGHIPLLSKMSNGCRHVEHLQNAPIGGAAHKRGT